LRKVIKNQFVTMSVDDQMENVPRETSPPGALAESLRRFLPEIAPEIVAVFEKHFQVLSRWNSRHNITRITDPVEAALLHYVDSLVPLLGQPAPLSVADIGSGTGLPGIAAAALWPATPVTLVDSSAKKSSFLRAVRAEIPSVRLEVLQGRCETLPELNADLVLIRATFQWPDVPALVARHLAPAGRLIAYLGQDAPTALEWKSAVARANLTASSVEKYALPGEKYTRHLARAQKE
jgi:16S rRNA (guanine527-N7)-methyltransferase